MTVRDLLSTSVNFDFIWIEHMCTEAYFKYKNSTQVKELDDEVISWYTQTRKMSHATSSEIVIIVK